MQLGDDARNYIIQQIKNSLAVQGGNFTNRDGELHTWFVEHLEGAAPMILINSLSDKKLLNMVYGEGYDVKSVAIHYDLHKSTIYRWINEAFNRAIDVMPEEMAVAILDVKLQQTARARLKAPKEEDGEWLLARDLASNISNGVFAPWRRCYRCGGNQFIDYIGSVAQIDWCCMQCGFREPCRMGDLKGG